MWDWMCATQAGSGRSPGHGAHHLGEGIGRVGERSGLLCAERVGAARRLVSKLEDTLVQVVLDEPPRGVHPRRAGGEVWGERGAPASESVRGV